MLGAAAMTGPGIGLFFVIVAPLPLMIVGLRWHPLLALLGGALTAAALAFFLRGSAAITFSMLVTLPAYVGQRDVLLGAARGRRPSPAPWLSFRRAAPCW